MEFNPSDMQKLVDLLRPPVDENLVQGDDDMPKTGYEISSTRKKAESGDAPKGPRNIEEFEAQQERECEQQVCVDDRKEPQYSMVYQQAVSAEDVYLQMGPKTPGSASCEHLIVRIKMNGDKRENVDLSVDKSAVSVSSSQYRLNLQLPHPVDPDGSKASWDNVEETLILTLKLDREFDYVNF